MKYKVMRNGLYWRLYFFHHYKNTFHIISGKIMFDRDNPTVSVLDHSPSTREIIMKYRSNKW